MTYIFGKREKITEAIFIKSRHRGLHDCVLLHLVPKGVWESALCKLAHRSFLNRPNMKHQWEVHYEESSIPPRKSAFGAHELWLSSCYSGCVRVYVHTLMSTLLAMSNTLLDGLPTEVIWSCYLGTMTPSSQNGGTYHRKEGLDESKHEYGGKTQELCNIAFWCLFWNFTLLFTSRTRLDVL